MASAQRDTNRQAHRLYKYSTVPSTRRYTNRQEVGLAPNMLIVTAVRLFCLSLSVLVGAGWCVPDARCSHGRVACVGSIACSTITQRTIHHSITW